MPRVAPVPDSGGARTATYALIEVPTDACDIVDFHRADEVIELSRGLAKQALDQAS